MNINRIDLRRTGIRITLAATFGGTLLGLYYAFRQLPAVTEQHHHPADGVTAKPLTGKPPDPGPHDGLGPKLQLSTRIGDELPATAAAPSLKLSTRTAPASASRTPKAPPPGSGELALEKSDGLFAAPAGKTAEPGLRADTAAPLHLSVAEGIGVGTGADDPPPRRNTLTPLRLSIAEQIDNLPAGGALALDASPGLTAARPGTPSAPEPQPGEPARQDNAPVLPTPERSGSRRPAQAENKPEEGDPVSSGDTAPSAFGWSIPPIRWGGQTGFQMSQSHNSGGANSSDMQEFINLRASSYIYQPWLAQISGNLALINSSGKSSSGSQADTTSSSRSMTGGATLNLFPASRFPALVTYDVSNSSSTSNVSGSDTTTTRFGIRQNYRPESGAYNVSGGYNNSTISSSMQGDDQVNALFGSFATSFATQRLTTNANYSESSGNRSGQSSSLLNLSATHTYQVLDNLLLDSLATLNDNTQTFLSGANLSETRGRTMQFSSNASWHPEENEDGETVPLNVNGGVRATSFQNDSIGSSTTIQSLSANAAAHYNYNDNLSLTGNGLVTQISGSDTGSQMFTLVGAGANYSGDPLTFGNYSYNWNAGANGAQQSGGGTGSNLTLSEQFGHTLGRAMKLSEDSSLSISLGQNASHTSSNQSDKSTSLSHNAGATYGKAFGDNISTSTSLNLSDTITAGTNASHYTNLNLQTQAEMQINMRSSASANLSVQRSASTISSLDGADTRNVTTNVFGSANYQHQRAFGVPNLRYNASLNANTTFRSSEERLAGNADAGEDVNYAFDNRLNYRIGLLDFQLRGTINSTAGQKNALIFFRVTRDF